MSFRKISTERSSDRVRFGKVKTAHSSNDSPAIPPAIAVSLLAGAFAAIFIAERRRPLRSRVEAQLPHVSRNVVMLALSAAATVILQRPLLQPLTERVDRERQGLLNLASFPQPMRTILGVVALDYSLWWWHWANHCVPLLWRFHLVHHVDLDLDSATALRFHFGEMSLSVFFRMAQIRVIGPDPLALSLWQLMLMISIVFHHSNLRLSAAVERALRRVFVTPAMHGIHHSDFHDETDSNWSSLFSVWDVLHHTARFDVPQSEITIGVPAWEDPQDVTLPRAVAIPFGPMRQEWVGQDGSVKETRRKSNASESVDAY